MRAYTKINTPTQGTIRPGQIENSCGAAVYSIDPWGVLDRFLIIGSEGGSYYVSEEDLTFQSYDNITALLNAPKNYLRFIDRVVEVSTLGQAPKNDPALFALAVASVHKDGVLRAMALDALPKVARIGTHLFNFLAFRKSLGGKWNRSFRRAIENWYNQQKNIELQLAKYQSRNGWSHRDLLRLAHPTPITPHVNAAFKWVMTGEADEQTPLLSAFNQIKSSEDEEVVLRVVKEFNMPLELVPTEKHTCKIYEAMLHNFGYTALLRNLGKLSSLGILEGENAIAVANRLTDKRQMGLTHPISILLALRVYSSGCGVKGSLTWKPSDIIKKALDEAFYLSFDNIIPTGKRIHLALDVSGSMSSDTEFGLASCEITAAMAMILLRTEENALITGFNRRLEELPINKDMRLEQVLDIVQAQNFGSTDCALPMSWSSSREEKFDAFVVFTDNETNAYNKVQPAAALQQYRAKFGIPAKLIVCSTEPTRFSIADPKDPLMLDIAGFDASAPSIISSFIAKGF